LRMVFSPAIVKKQQSEGERMDESSAAIGQARRTRCCRRAR